MSAHRRRPSRQRQPRTVLTALAALGALAVVAFVGYWAVTGGRWLIVRTPSMGTAAPVGTLLWVEPVATRDIGVGDIISFHPPGRDNVTFSHRVDAIALDGTITTKGDANPVADPWQLHGSDVIGEVSMRWWGAGWLVRAAPLLMLGSVMLFYGLRRFLALRWQLPVTTIGVAVILTAAIYIYQPLVQAQLVTYTQVGDLHPAARATYVSTGVLPVRVTAAGGRHVDLRSGELGTVLATKLDNQGRFTSTVTPHLSPWWWLILLGACFVPALWTLVTGVSPERAALRRPQPAG